MIFGYKNYKFYFSRYRYVGKNNNLKKKYE